MRYRTLLLIGLMSLNTALLVVDWSFQIAAVMHAPGSWRLLGALTVLLLILAGPLVMRLTSGAHGASSREYQPRKWLGIPWTDWLGLLLTPVACLPILWAALLAPPFWAGMGVVGYVSLFLGGPTYWMVRWLRGGDGI